MAVVVVVVVVVVHVVVGLRVPGVVNCQALALK